MSTQINGSYSILPINKLCKELQVTPRTLRYWEEEGLIISVERPDRSIRGYTAEMAERIRFIIKLKKLGLSIKEIQHLGNIYDEARRTEALLPDLMDLLVQHIKTIDEKIAQLSELRNEIIKYLSPISTKSNAGSV